MSFIKSQNVDTFVTLSKNNDPDSFNDFVLRYNVKAFHEHKKTIYELIPEGITIEQIFDNRHISTNLYNCLSMFYCHYCNMNMIKQYENKHKFKYDVIIYARTDGILKDPIPLHLFSDNILNVPNQFDFSGLNDQFAFGPRDIMETYCNLYPNIVKYRLDDNIMFHPESLLFHHVTSCNLSVRRFNFQYELDSSRHLRESNENLPPILIHMLKAASLTF
jgi:hypothetical protein